MALQEKDGSTAMHLNPVEHGPLEESSYLSAGLDYYKATMSQLEWQKFPEAEVTFTFKNRSNTSLAEYVEVEELQRRFEELSSRSWDDHEIDYLRSLTNSVGSRIFSDEFLDYLRTNQLPAVNVGLDPISRDLAIDTSGRWPLVTFWETIVMSEVNEAYFEGLMSAKGINPADVYAEGNRRLDEKIAFFQQHPDIKFADFGTRRRFSLRWHRHVVERLQAECPENFIGTSNVALALTLGLKPIGTYAHELPMVYAAIADATGKDIRRSQGQLMDDWDELYGDDLSIHLSDTFGSDAFFEDLTVERAVRARGSRQDSGDPIAYGEKAIDHYQRLGVDPTDKAIVFSDNLNTVKVERIHNIFKDRLIDPFGIGNFFTNDLGLKAPNNVMKATKVRLPDGRQAETVKLSDDAGKHTGPPAQIKRYQDVFGKKS